VPTISWFIRQYQKTYSSIRVEKEIDLEEGDVSALLRRSIYRIMQEAFNNIAKHSQAKIVRLALKREENRIELTIQDDGTGFRLRGDAFPLKTLKRGSPFDA